jgi:hypothetical protein
MHKDGKKKLNEAHEQREAEGRGRCWHGCWRSGRDEAEPNV